MNHLENVCEGLDSISYIQVYVVHVGFYFVFLFRRYRLIDDFVRFLLRADLNEATVENYTSLQMQNIQISDGGRSKRERMVLYSCRDIVYISERVYLISRSVMLRHKTREVRGRFVGHLVLKWIEFVLLPSFVRRRFPI